MAKQPFYHSLEARFTATEDLSSTQADLEVAMESFLKGHYGPGVIVTGSCNLDFCEAEPGDPADLDEEEVDPLAKVLTEFLVALDRNDTAESAVGIARLGAFLESEKPVTDEAWAVVKNADVRRTCIAGLAMIMVSVLQ